MLQVPRFRQPDEVTCLATCVRCVLAYRGHTVSDEEAANACRITRRGAVLDLAGEGLAEAGFDAEIYQSAGLDDLRDRIQDDQPVVVVLRHPSGSLHAVVVCDVTPDGVVVMDPALGDYTVLPTPRFEALWCRVQNEALVIAGVRADRAPHAG